MITGIDKRTKIDDILLRILSLETERYKTEVSNGNMLKVIAENLSEVAGINLGFTGISTASSLFNAGSYSSKPDYFHDLLSDRYLERKKRVTYSGSYTALTTSDFWSPGETIFSDTIKNILTSIGETDDHDLVHVRSITFKYHDTLGGNYNSIPRLWVNKQASGWIPTRAFNATTKLLTHELPTFFWFRKQEDNLILTWTNMVATNVLEWAIDFDLYDYKNTDEVRARLNKTF